MNKIYWRDWKDIDLNEARKNKLNIPQEFKDRCLKAFPDDELIKELLEEDSFALVIVLDRRKSETISKEEGLVAIENGNYEKLSRKAKSIKNSLILFKEIYQMYEEQYISEGSYVNREGHVLNQPNLKYLYRCHRNSTLVGVYPSKGVSKKCLSACDYNDACRAKGLNQAGNHIAGGQGLD